MFAPNYGLRHRRCQEQQKARRNGLDSWIFPVETLGLGRFNARETKPTRCASRELRHLLGFHAPIHLDPIEIHASGHCLTLLVAAIPHKPMRTHR